MTLMEEYFSQSTSHSGDCLYHYSDYNNYSDYHDYSDGPETSEDD